MDVKMLKGLPCAVFAALFVASAACAQDAPGRFRVTGEATISVPADRARISIGVETQNDDLHAAVGQNSETIAAVVERIRAAGIADPDIQTSGFTVGQTDRRYVEVEGAAPRPKYEVSNTLDVLVRDLDGLGDVLGAVSANGANSIDSLVFLVADAAPHRAKARELAVQDARQKADLYAAAAGVKLGRLISFTEGTSASSFESEGITVEPLPILREPSVPISSAEVTFREGVTLVYEIAE